MTAPDVTDVLDMIHAGHTTYEVADKLGLTCDGVAYRLKQAGYPRLAAEFRAEHGRRHRAAVYEQAGADVRAWLTEGEAQAAAEITQHQG